MLRIIFVFFYPPKVYVAFKITIGLKFNSDQSQTNGDFESNINFKKIKIKTKKKRKK
jgi:hypothetical protein